MMEPSTPTIVQRDMDCICRHSVTYPPCERCLDMAANVETLVFRFAYDRAVYGDSAVVVGQQTVVSRPFGTRTRLVDLVTSNGTAVQWARGVVAGRTWTGWAAEVAAEKWAKREVFNMPLTRARA